MEKKKVIKFFGTQEKTAEALSIKQPSVADWPAKLPETTALLVDKVTGGRLKYDPRQYGRKLHVSAGDAVLRNDR